MEYRHDIFLSYSRKDKTTIQRIHNDLRMAGLRVWTDEGIVLGTPNWRKAIQDAIETTGALVALFSPDAKQSEWVNEELNYATTHNKLIFPLLVRGTEKTAIPFGFSAAQRIDIRQEYTPVILQLIPEMRECLNLPNIFQPGAEEAAQAEHRWQEIKVAEAERRRKTQEAVALERKMGRDGE